MRRFKTEEEFIQESGPKWRTSYKDHWVPGMNFKLGMRLTKEEEERIEKYSEFRVILGDLGPGYTFTEDMTIKISLYECLQEIYQEFGYDKVALKILQDAKRR
jgi:predicted GNAT family N-acyltransferase